MESAERTRLFRLIYFFLAILNLSSPSSGLAINNGVVGQPTVRCTEDSVSFSVRSQDIFRGNIYIKGRYNDPSCRLEYRTNDFNGGTFSVRIGQCGMRRIRQLQPNGMNYILVFVVNFHHQFVTKVDRAYNVRCFYAQVDKTVTSQLEVSMLSTQSLEDQTMLMPNCEYSVRHDNLNGPRVRYAQVGDRLFHRWECDNPNYGMLVKNCFVNDGSGSSVRVLDTRGCPVFTPVIQGNLQYDTSLNLAYAEIWAYKFPDRSNLFFQCQIQICNKRDNECIGVTPPNCPRVLKSEFQPSSVIDGSVNPPRVISTGNAPGGGLQPVLPSNVRTNANLRLPGTNYQANAGISPQEALIKPAGINNGNNPFDTHSHADHHTNDRSNQGGGFTDPRLRGRLPQPTDRFANPDQLRALQAARFQGFRRDQPAAEFKEKTPEETNPPKPLEIQRNRNKRETVEVNVRIPPQNRDPLSPVEEDLQLEREEGNNLIDVTSGEVFIADVDDDPDKDNKDFTHFPFGTTRDAGSKELVCFNQAGIGLLITCFAISCILICALLFYLVSSKNRRDRKKKGRSFDTASQSTSSSTSGCSQASSPSATSISGLINRFSPLKRPDTSLPMSTTASSQKAFTATDNKASTSSNTQSC